MTSLLLRLSQLKLNQLPTKGSLRLPIVLLHWLLATSWCVWIALFLFFLLCPTTDWKESRSTYCPKLPSLKPMAAMNRGSARRMVPTSVDHPLEVLE